MAAPGHFQLFPPPPPPKTNRDSNNPFRRNGMSRLSTVPTTTSTIIEDVSNESPEVQRSADGVEIQVFKEISPVQEPPKVHVQPIRAASPPTKPIEAGPSTFPKRNISLSKRPTRIDTGKGRASPLPMLQEHVSPNRKSPVVAIRSMFPRYNPGVPLTKQSYYPQRVKTPENIPERAISRNEYSPSAASVSRIDEIVGGPKTAPASVLNFPTDVLDVDPAPISTIGELKTLWEAANGQGPEFATESFNLKLSRMEEATFTFGSAPAAPFYTLQTYSTNELFISRTHPLNAHFTLPILRLSLEPPYSSSPQSNHNNSTTNLLASSVKSSRPRTREMISYIFPELAAMLAKDQAETLAVQHRVAPTVKTQMLHEAHARAAAQEASRLYWNETERRYELEHPAIGKDQPGSPTALVPSDDAEGSSPQTSPPVLHITVTIPDIDLPHDQTVYPTIAVTDPNQSYLPPKTTPDATPPPPSRRASIQPLPDNSSNDTLPAPLASLTFTSTTPTLSIDTALITRLLPSLYAIDSLVAALLAVAVADSTTNPLLADMPTYDPLTEYRKHVPRVPSSAAGSHYAGSIAGASTIGGKSYAGSVLYATLAEREEAEQEARLMRQLHKKDVKNKSLHRKSLAAFNFPTTTASSSHPEDGEEEEDDDFYLDEKERNPKNKKKKKKNRKTRVTIQEFDLEKYTTYQSGSREGEKLPGVVRTVVACLFWGLKVFVSMLSLFVECVAKVLVVGSRCVTSEDF